MVFLNSSKTTMKDILCDLDSSGTAELWHRIRISGNVLQWAQMDTHKGNYRGYKAECLVCGSLCRVAWHPDKSSKYHSIHIDDTTEEIVAGITSMYSVGPLGWDRFFTATVKSPPLLLPGAGSVVVAVAEQPVPRFTKTI